MSYIANGSCGFWGNIRGNVSVTFDGNTFSVSLTITDWNGWDNPPSGARYNLSGGTTWVRHNGVYGTSDIPLSQYDDTVIGVTFYSGGYMDSAHTVAELTSDYLKLSDIIIRPKLAITSPPSSPALIIGKTYRFTWESGVNGTYTSAFDTGASKITVKTGSRNKYIDFTIPNTWQNNSYHTLYVNDTEYILSDSRKYLVISANNELPKITEFTGKNYREGRIPTVNYTLYDKEDFPAATVFRMYHAKAAAPNNYTSYLIGNTISNLVKYRTAEDRKKYLYDALPSGVVLAENDRIIYEVSYLDIVSETDTMAIHDAQTAYIGQDIIYSSIDEAKKTPYIVLGDNIPPWIDIEEVDSIPTRTPHTFTWSMGDEDGDDVTIVDAVIVCDNKVYRPDVQDYSLSLSWSPERELAQKRARLTVTVTDGKYKSSDYIEFDIYDANLPPVPVIRKPEKMSANENIVFEWDASDPDGDSISLVSAVIEKPGSVIDVPIASITRSGNKWSYAWKVTATKGQQVKLTVTVSDGSLQGSTSKTWTVDAPNCNVAVVIDGVIVRVEKIAYVKNGVITSAEPYVRAILNGKVV